MAPLFLILGEGGGSSFYLIFICEQGWEGSHPRRGLGPFTSVHGLAAPEDPLGFRDHGGCAGLLSHRCCLACWEFVRDEPHMTATANEDKLLLSSAG